MPKSDPQLPEPSSELLKLKRELGRSYARKVTSSADRLWDERGMSAKLMEAWLRE